MSEQPEGLSKLLPSLTYADGSDRRRLVVGVLFLAGVAAIEGPGSTADLSKTLFGMDLLEVLKSPVLLFVLLILAYAIGNLIEVFDDILIAPYACGIIGGWRASTANTRWLSRNFYLKSKGFYGALKGVLLRARLELDVASLLSPSARGILLSSPETALPEAVVDGIRHPLGPRSELTANFLTNSLSSDKNQRWAMRTIARSKDVSSLIAVITLLLAFGVAPRVIDWVGNSLGISLPEDKPKLEAAAALINDVSSALDAQRDGPCAIICTRLINIQDA